MTHSCPKFEEVALVKSTLGRGTATSTSFFDSAKANAATHVLLKATREQIEESARQVAESIAAPKGVQFRRRKRHPPIRSADGTLAAIQILVCAQVVRMARTNREDRRRTRPKDLSQPKSPSAERQYSWQQSDRERARLPQAA